MAASADRSSSLGLVNGRNKAFFFFNYEELRQPSDTTRSRNILNTDAASGIYRYTATGGAVQTVNLLQLAATNNQVATIDPMIGKLLGDIRSATSGGSLAAIDPNLQRFSFNVPVESKRRFPTVRIDYNLTDKHRFSSAWNYNWFTDLPDTLNNFDQQFPGFPVDAGQSSVRWSWSNTMRSTLTQNIVNEARVGYSSSPVTFFKELNTGMFGGTSVADQGGFQLTFSPNANNGGIDGTVLTNASPAPAPQDRNATALLIENTLTWLKGSHNLSMGGSWTQYRARRAELGSRADDLVRSGRGRPGAEPVHRGDWRGGVPGRVCREPGRRSEYLRAPDRSREQRRRRRAARRGHQPVHLYGHRHAARPDARGRILRSGLLAVETELHGQPRAAL